MKNKNIKRCKDTNDNYQGIEDYIIDDINLYSDKHILFITDENFNFVYQTGELSDFFKKYMEDASFDPDTLQSEDDLKNIPVIHTVL